MDVMTWPVVRDRPVGTNDSPTAMTIVTEIAVVRRLHRTCVVTAVRDRSLPIVDPAKTIAAHGKKAVVSMAVDRRSVRQC